jgi:hypothetical protein
LTAADGIARDHGFKGAFVSKWTIDKATLTVLHGEDLMKRVFSPAFPARPGEVNRQIRLMPR